jgi:hypothetical protein
MSSAVTSLNLKDKLNKLNFFPFCFISYIFLFFPFPYFRIYYSYFHPIFPWLPSLFTSVFLSYSPTAILRFYSILSSVILFFINFSRPFSLSFFLLHLFLVSLLIPTFLFSFLVNLLIHSYLFLFLSLSFLNHFLFTSFIHFFPSFLSP